MSASSNPLTFDAGRHACPPEVRFGEKNVTRYFRKIA